MTEHDMFLAACLPADIRDLPPVPGLKLPVPLVDDTLMQCPICERDMWVGPRKKFLAALGGCELLCYFCLFDIMHANPEATLVYKDLHPERVERPRR